MKNIIFNRYDQVTESEMAGHVARMGRRGMHIGSWLGKRPLGGPSRGGWIILKWILER
jgi:hypothetical protein